jgi:hypothetical protein
METVLILLQMGIVDGNCRVEMYTAISIKVVHEQSGKVEYERERLLGIAIKIH